MSIILQKTAISSFLSTRESAYESTKDMKSNPVRTGYKNAPDKKKKICVAPKVPSSKKHPLFYRYLTR
jgi:hypothetical protein